MRLREQYKQETFCDVIPDDYAKWLEARVKELEGWLQSKEDTIALNEKSITELKKRKEEFVKKLEELNLQCRKLDYDNGVLRGNLTFYRDAYDNATKMLEHYRRAYADYLKVQLNGH